MVVVAAAIAIDLSEVRARQVLIQNFQEFM
jgi:hypothetical protein